MKFNKIRLIGLHTTELPIDDASPSDPYILKGSDGLGPPEIDVALAETLHEGFIYQGSKAQGREIVIRIGLNPDYGVGQTAAEMRTTLYGLLTPGASGNVLIELVDGVDVVATATGYVKRLEIAPFSETPEVQVTFACLHPYLQAPNILYVTPGGTLPNPEIENTGTAPTGFRMEVLFAGSVSGWSLTNTGNQKIEVDYDFILDDVLTIDTRAGLRGVWLYRNFETNSILHALVAGSTWHTLHGGVNSFVASSPNFTWGDVFFRPQYWGV